MLAQLRIGGHDPLGLTPRGGDEAGGGTLLAEVGDLVVELLGLQLEDVLQAIHGQLLVDELLERR